MRVIEGKERKAQHLKHLTRTGSEGCSSDGSEIHTGKPSLSTQARSGLPVTCAYRILFFSFTELSRVSDS